MPDPSARPFELVEHKGIGHPDTICDALAEQFSRALCRFYLDRFGVVLHHNVDKVLLRGGAARPRFGGGEVVAPIEIYLAGRATTDVRGVKVPVDELAVEVSRAFFRETMHTLDVDRHVVVRCLVRPGSTDLLELFSRRQGSGTWLANDSSIGVGYAPLSPLERNVLALDARLRSAAVRKAHPAFGEDTKVLALRQGGEASLTIACAFCDRFVPDLRFYLSEKREIAALARAVFDGDVDISVNAADDPDAGSVYLTVTGTSAEGGDDGEAGRGNRANGLITPCRPMTMESVAGKNPVSHVGKIYSHVAHAIAASIVAEAGGVAAAECYLASRIGSPVDEPRLTQVRLAMADGRSPNDVAGVVQDVVRRQLGGLGTLSETLVQASPRPL